MVSFRDVLLLNCKSEQHLSGAQPVANFRPTEFA
jgi:hypothetical protein